MTQRQHPVAPPRLLDEQVDRASRDLSPPPSSAVSGAGRVTESLVRKLRRRDEVSEEEERALAAIVDAPRVYKAGTAFVRPGDRPVHSTLLIEGLCARYSLLKDGKRSFTELSIAGDFVDLHSLLMAQMDHGVLALTDCVVAPAPHERLIRLTETQPHLTRLLWLDTVIDGAIHREWLHRMGAQDAIGRMAHLICEMQARLGVVGLSTAEGFDLHVTQSELGECLGISAVHVNRTLMELRRLRLVEWRGPRVRILDQAGLNDLAEFDPTYLRLASARV